MKHFFLVSLAWAGLSICAPAADKNATVEGEKKPKRTIRYPARPLWLGRDAADPGASRWMLRLDMQTFKKTMRGLYP